MNYESIESNAVLTPHLNSPIQGNTFSFRVREHKHKQLEPVGEDVKNQRRLWCERQVKLLKLNPSNAVLMGQTS